MARYFFFLALVFSAVLVVRAQLAFNPLKCVDPTGFKTCWAKAVTNADICYGEFCNGGECTDQYNCYSNDPYCAESCVCVAYRDWINCALSHCWNKVYSCAYQSLVVKAFMECGIATRFPPYWPAPASAPNEGACSCNIGGAYKAIRLYYGDGPTCENNVQGIKYFEECICCALSGQVSALANICPATDPSSITYWSDIEDLSAASAAFPSCTSVMATATCTASPLYFNTPSLNPSGKFYAPGKVPAPGTEAVSNLPGSLTAPLSGTVITWSLAKNGLTGVATAVAAPTG